MGQRVDLDGLGDVAVDLGDTGEGVAALDVHGARATDTLTARTAEGQGRVLLVLDFNQGVENHGTACVQIDLVGLEVGLLGGLVRALEERN